MIMDVGTFLDFYTEQHNPNLLAETHASAGFQYERVIQLSLVNAGLAPKEFANKTAGSGHGADAYTRSKEGKLVGIEVKLSPNVFAGQKNIVYIKGGTARWTKADDLTAFYDEINLLNDFVLPQFGEEIEKRLYIMNKWLKSKGINKQIKGFPTSLTTREYVLLRKQNPDFVPELGTVEPEGLINAIYANYNQKGVYYLQIGTSAGGFYYLSKDPLKLAKQGVPQFRPKVVKVRTRLKWGGSSSNTLSLNTGLVIGGVTPSPVSLDDDLTFLKKGLGYR